MMGEASSESSHVLCSTMVERPPSMISDVYSSMARLLSPTYGTYLITTCRSEKHGSHVTVAHEQGYFFDPKWAKHFLLGPLTYNV